MTVPVDKGEAMSASNGLRSMVNAFGVRGTISIFVLLATAAVVMVRIVAPEGQEDFRQAERVIGQMTASTTLESVGFFDEYPNGSPSQFVAFLETDKGQRLWPMTIREHHQYRYDNPGISTMKGRFLRPNDVAFVASSRAPSKGRQVVYEARDDAGFIELRGYDPEHEGPVFLRQIPFPSQYNGLEL
jgi:hypothetical protein